MFNISCVFLLQDVITYSVLSFLYLFGTSLVASAIDYYQKLDGNVTQWTIEQLIVSVVSTGEQLTLKSSAGECIPMILSCDSSEKIPPIC